MAELRPVILSAIDNSNKKAVLDFKNDNEEYCGSIRLYNFKNIPHGIFSLGFLVENQVIKAALTEKENGLYSFNFKYPENITKFSCALVLIQGGEPKPILLGTNDKSLSNDLSVNLVKNFKFLDEKNVSVKNVEDSLNSCGIDFEKEENEEIVKTIDIECRNDRCSRCNYRSAFYNGYEDIKLVEKSKNEVKNDFQKIHSSSDEEGSFYREVKDQINLLFEKYPEDLFLTEVIPNSKWIKVDYEDDGHYIVIGLIYENNKVRYVCYGSPGEYSIQPPHEFKELSQWLPLDPEKPKELGYWIIYQDAETGESIEVNVS